MAIELDHETWQSADRHPAEAGGRKLLDWHSMRERLLAARQLRLALAADRPAGESANLGSFSTWAARRIDALSQPSPFVNPNDSANRNADRAIETFVADEFSSGDRG